MTDAGKNGFSRIESGHEMVRTAAPRVAAPQIFSRSVTRTGARSGNTADHLVVLIVILPLPESRDVVHCHKGRFQRFIPVFSPQGFLGKRPRFLRQTHGSASFIRRMKYHFSISFLIRFSLSQSNSPVKDREKKCRVPLFRFIQRAKPRFYLPVFHGKVILESGGKTLAIAFAFMAPGRKNVATALRFCLFKQLLSE